MHRRESEEGRRQGQAGPAIDAASLQCPHDVFRHRTTFIVHGKSGHRTLTVRIERGERAAALGPITTSATGRLPTRSTLGHRAMASNRSGDNCVPLVPWGIELSPSIRCLVVVLVAYLFAGASFSADRKKVLHVASTNIETLDPQRWNDDPSYQIQFAIFEGLYEWD